VQQKGPIFGLVFCQFVLPFLQLALAEIEVLIVNR
jgi:hypothetical protein